MRDEPNRRVDEYRAEGQWREVITIAQRALADDNLQEPMHRALMEAQARLGERAGALRQYETLRATLARELGVAPLPETEGLRAAILNGRFDSTKPITPQIPPQTAPQSAVPPPPAPFVGRVAAPMAGRWPWSSWGRRLVELK